jgi:hypothetical protein
MDEILNYLIANGHITQEAFDEAVAAKQKELADNPPPFVADVNQRAGQLEEKTVLMQEVDFMTLDQTWQLDTRSLQMQETDNFTLELVFEMKDEIAALRAEIETLKGGTN